MFWTPGSFNLETGLVNGSGDDSWAKFQLDHVLLWQDKSDMKDGSWSGVVIVYCISNQV